jgi:hypothetical protein
MTLCKVINKCYYGSVGYINNENDIFTLERYILHNLPVLKEFKGIITSTTYKENNTELHNKLEGIWKKYFPNSIHINLGKSRGHSFGAADNDDAIFDYCKKNNIEWVCKSANDMILQESILDKEVEEADFYYLNGIGYGGMVKYEFDFGRIIKEDFYPQTNFYILNAFKCDYLNDRQHINEVYDAIKNIADYNGKAWEYGFRSCETLLKECIERNNLSKYHLASIEKYITLLQLIKEYQVHDSSHKNIMIDGMCHFQFFNQQIVNI